MMVPVVRCFTLLTVPPFPDPSSLRMSRSSGFKSSLYSMLISSCSSSFLDSAGGGGFAADGVRARPLTFLRFIDRGANGSPMVAAMLRLNGEEGRREAVRIQRVGQARRLRVSSG